jgi:NAD(P)-dependent dehydrogenase (short-subunit alcohol dehydrogenase family)
MPDQMTARWTLADVPDQSGRVAVITGSNTGVGYEAAAMLAAKGAHVVLAVRNVDKGAAARTRIVGSHPDAPVTVQKLDLASLDSVRTAADELRAAHPRIDLLINNAGVMTLGKSATPDGFEMQFGTNHLGHFALTGLLLDAMLTAEKSRVVTMSSPGHRILSTIDFDHLKLDSSYSRFTGYGRSKLANLLFTYELARRLDAKGAPTAALAAHPGAANTDLLRSVPSLLRRPVDFAWSRYSQSASAGALPPLRAATDPGALNGQYYGPDGFAEQRGHPTVIDSNAQSHDRALQRRLWEASEELTGVRYPV